MLLDSLELPDTSHAVVLAAGRGSRLRPDEGYKLLVEIDGRTLLDHHLRNFARLGVTDVTIVTGYRHAELDKKIQDWPTAEEIDLHIAVNPAFDGGNGVSVLAGVMQARHNRDVADAEPYWLTMSDHLFQPTVFEDLAERVGRTSGSSVGGMLVVDSKIETIFDLEDANKIRTTDEGRLDAIGKGLDAVDLVDAGLFWCGRAFSDALDRERRERGDCSTSDAVRSLAAEDDFAFYDLGNALWQDVDTPGARRHAERIRADRDSDVEIESTVTEQR